VTISTNASEETFEFFVNQAEKNNTLIKEQLDAVPSAMNLTINTQFQNNLFEETPFCDRNEFTSQFPRFLPKSYGAIVERKDVEKLKTFLEEKHVQQKFTKKERRESETQDH
jgi:hypothetical protein